MTGKKWTWLSLLLASLLVLSVGLIGCDDDDEDDDVVTGNPVELAREGWDEFEDLNYSAALELFEQAISAGARSTDAWGGAGWSCYMMGDHTAALDFWEDGFERIGDKNDILTGQGFEAFDRADHTTCIEKFSQVIADNPSYQFEHHSGTDVLDLTWMMASSHLLQGNFTESYELVLVLNPNFSADLGTEAGRDALGAELDRLMPIIRG